MSNPKIVTHPFAFLPNGIHLFGVLLIRKSVMNEELIQHETVHYHQWKKEPWSFYFKYVFCRKCRLAYEVEAYKKSIEYGLPVELCAKVLSGPLYLWVTDYETALKLLKE
jgi:hypothetical protein